MSGELCGTATATTSRYRCVIDREGREDEHGAIAERNPRGRHERAKLAVKAVRAAPTRRDASANRAPKTSRSAVRVSSVDG